MKYVYESEWIEGVIVKKNSQYTMNVEIFGEEYKCYFPCKDKIGNIRFKGVACLVSVTQSLTRQTSFTIEAISLDALDVKEKTWICVDPKIIEKSIKYLCPDMIFDALQIQYQPLYVSYGSHIKTQKTTPMISIDQQLDEIEKKGIQKLGKVYSYDIQEFPELALNDQQLYRLDTLKEKGFTCWNLSLKVEKDGISLEKIEKQ